MHSHKTEWPDRKVLWVHCIDPRLHEIKQDKIRGNFQQRVVAGGVPAKGRGEMMDLTIALAKKREIEYLIVESHPDCAAVDFAKDSPLFNVITKAWENFRKNPDWQKYPPAERNIMVAQEVTRLSVSNAINDHNWDAKKVIGLYADFKNKYQVLVDDKFIAVDKLTAEQKKAFPEWLIEQITPKPKENNKWQERLESAINMPRAKL